MAVRILHLSDLHVGHGKTWEPLPAVESLVESLAPDLLLVTGDLAHRGRLQELEAAVGLLRGLGVPLLTVPGNHDIPYTVPARFTRTFRAWTEAVGPTEPEHVGDGLAVAGLNSARPWRLQGGAVEESALTRALDGLAAAPADALRVVAVHHHLATPPWRAARKLPLSRRDDLLRRFRAAGVELVAGGHVHQASVTEPREFRVLDGSGVGSLVIATAPGIGRPRPDRREEVRGAMVYEADPDELRVTTYAWTGGALEEIARRAFPRR